MTLTEVDGKPCHVTTEDIFGPLIQEGDEDG
jgi:hypothetical protein